ncbi:MAG: F0F1 ATP synthase subunit gamma [Peptostreptococcaceae bacterium]|nr:F0F1 ATP synthase subunit gamma [Peptostreptococcaceae bacterium]
MSDSNESMRRKISGAKSIKSVVRTMKAIAGSNIYEYEKAVNALDEYYYATKMSLVAYFRANKPDIHHMQPDKLQKDKGTIGAIVFGADQGLVGQFNDIIAEYAMKELSSFNSKIVIWAVGEGVHGSLTEAGIPIEGSFKVPNSVKAITPLVADILMESEMRINRNEITEFHIFYNHNSEQMIYEPVHKRLLPLDKIWMSEFIDIPWPTACIPEVIGDPKKTLYSLIHEYIFAGVFRACAESLEAENASRLATAQRADKNIGEILETLERRYQELRQSTIDEEMFDIVSCFEIGEKSR